MATLQLGKRNQLKVLREKEHGVYLEGGDIGDILLPKRYVPAGTKVGDILDVFLYLDQEERLIATTEHPLIEVGQFAYLECTWTNEYGAYLNWGLMKDLFCPFREQKVRMQRGKRYQVYCYIDDKTYRIVCSSKIEKFQKAISEKTANAKPSTFNAQPNRTVLIGDFSTRLFEYLKLSERGFAPYHDKSPAEDIYATFGVSKKVFKQAVGDLLKRGLIQIRPDGIELTLQGKATDGETASTDVVEIEVSTDVTAINAVIAPNDIQLKANGNKVPIESGTPLRHIRIYSINGMLLSEKKVNGTHRASLSVNAQQRNMLLLVQVETDAGTKTFHVRL